MANLVPNNVFTFFPWKNQYRLNKSRKTYLEAYFHWADCFPKQYGSPVSGPTPTMWFSWKSIQKNDLYCLFLYRQSKSRHLLILFSYFSKFNQENLLILISKNYCRKMVTIKKYKWIKKTSVCTGTCGGNGTSLNTVVHENVKVYMNQYVKCFLKFP